MYSQHCLTPGFDFVWYCYGTSDSYILICYLCHCDLMELDVPAPLEQLYVLQQTFFHYMLGLSCT